MNRKEQLKKQIAQLTKELEEFENESERGKWKRGEWLMGKNGSLVRFSHYEADPESFTSSEIIGGTLENHDSWHVPAFRKATPSEIESALRSEWNRRCIEAGWDSGDEAEIEADCHGDSYGINSRDYDPDYEEDEDLLWTVNGEVYCRGVWATPKPRKKVVKFFEWEVKNEKAIICIGCKKYSKGYLNEIQHHLSYLQSETTVQDILNELKKLDL